MEGNRSEVAKVSSEGIRATIKYWFLNEKQFNHVAKYQHKSFQGKVLPVNVRLPGEGFKNGYAVPKSLLDPPHRKYLELEFFAEVQVRLQEDVLTRENNLRPKHGVAQYDAYKSRIALTDRRATVSEGNSKKDKKAEKIPREIKTNNSKRYGMLLDIEGLKEERESDWMRRPERSSKRKRRRQMSTVFRKTPEKMMKLMKFRKRISLRHLLPQMLKTSLRRRREAGEWTFWIPTNFRGIRT